MVVFPVDLASLYYSFIQALAAFLAIIEIVEVQKMEYFLGAKAHVE